MSVCQSQHAQSIPMPTESTCCRVAPRRPACCWSNWYGIISCFRLLWCVLQLQWGRLLYQHPVPIQPSPQWSSLFLLRWGDGWVGTGCCEQTVLSKTGQTVKTRSIISIRLFLLCQVSLILMKLSINNLIWGQGLQSNRADFEYLHKLW